MMRIVPFVAFIALGALAGCSSVDEETPAPAPARFIPDDAAASPSVSLREHELTADALVLDVVAHGVTNLYGIAFRLESAPGVLTLTSFEASALWDDFPDSIARGKDARAGLGYYVVTAKGLQTGLSADDEVLATLRLTRVPGDSPVRFVAPRSEVIGDDGRPVDDVSWVGGTLQSER